MWDNIKTILSIIVVVLIVVVKCCAPFESDKTTGITAFRDCQACGGTGVKVEITCEGMCKTYYDCEMCAIRSQMLKNGKPYLEERNSELPSNSNNYNPNSNSCNNQPIQNYSNPYQGIESAPSPDDIYLGQECKVCGGDGDEIVNFYSGSDVSVYCDICNRTFDTGHYHRTCKNCGGNGSY